MAIALAKRYCREDRYALEWTEFLNAEVAKIRSFVVDNNYPTNPQGMIVDMISKSEIVRRACLVCGRWGTAQAKRSVIHTIQLLADFKHVIRFGQWSELRYFSAAICFYWALVGNVAADDFVAARDNMYGRLRTSTGDDFFVSRLPFLRVLDNDDWRIFKGFESARVPASEFALALLRNEISEAGIDQSEAEELFNRVELLISLECVHVTLQEFRESGIPLSRRPPFGRYVWNQERDQILRELVGKTERLPRLLAAGLLGGDAETATATIDSLRRFVNEVAPYGR